MHIRSWTDRDIVELSPGPDPHNSADGTYIIIPVGQIDELIDKLQQAKEFAQGKASYCSFEVRGVK